jgi:hypothetical protein
VCARRAARAVSFAGETTLRLRRGPPLSGSPASLPCPCLNQARCARQPNVFGCVGTDDPQRSTEQGKPQGGGVLRRYE